MVTRIDSGLNDEIGSQTMSVTVWRLLIFPHLVTPHKVSAPQTT